MDVVITAGENRDELKAIFLDTVISLGSTVFISSTYRLFSVKLHRLEAKSWRESLFQDGRVFQKVCSQPETLLFSAIHKISLHQCREELTMGSTSSWGFSPFVSSRECGMWNAIAPSGLLDVIWNREPSTGQILHSHFLTI